MPTLCVLGGTGFVGQHLVSHLANAGYRVKVLTRHRHRHRQLLVMPRVSLIDIDIRNPAALQAQFAGCRAVINLIGILNGSEQEFRALHAELPEQLAIQCQQAGVSHLLHMSALNANAEQGPSLYLRTKGEGERSLRSLANLHTTIFQPSVIFGPEDNFFNRFAMWLKISPIFPLACAEARFAPVYIGDVVSAFVRALDNPVTFAQTLELCGPRCYTLRQLVGYTAQLLDRRVRIVNLPDRLARLQAQILTYFPGQPFTLDNYLSLQVASVCRSNGLELLSITPQSVEAVMPAYFAGQFSRAVRYRNFRRNARHEAKPVSREH